MYSPQTLSVKPYNACLKCQHRINSRCDGPRTSGMELLRWCEFMRDLKTVSGFTNAEVAAGSDVSIKTIERIMAMKCDQDIYRDTARRIENFLFGSSNQFPCYLAFEESVPQHTDGKLDDAMRELERALQDNLDYRNALDNIHSSYKEEMQIIRDEDQRKISFLRDQLDRLQKENDNLWAENNRKARIVETFLIGKFPELMNG